MDLLRTSIFYRCQADYLLNLIMYLPFQIPSLLLLIFSIDDQEYMASKNFRIMICFIFINIFIKIYHL